MFKWRGALLMMSTALVFVGHASTTHQTLASWVQTCSSWQPALAQDHVQDKEVAERECPLVQWDRRESPSCERCHVMGGCWDHSGPALELSCRTRRRYLACSGKSRCCHCQISQTTCSYRLGRDGSVLRANGRVRMVGNYWVAYPQCP